MGKRIPMWQVLVVMLFTIAALMYAMDIWALIFKNTSFGESLASGYGELHIPLIASAIFAATVAVLNGYKWSFLEAGILASINRSMQAMLILLTVGLLIGSWIAAGVVPAMIYYGLAILKPSIFLFAACILSAIVSISTGSSWTTAGTIGIALIGIGTGLGISSAMTAGAIVSGAYVGDKMSPLSDTTNLAPAVAGSNLFDHIRHMVWTVTPSIVIALILYLILGMGAGEADLSIVKSLQEDLSASFTINPALLLPPVLVIVIVALKLPALPGLMGGILLGCIFGSIFQGVSLADWPGILHYGYEFAVSDAFTTTSEAIVSANPSIAADYEVGALIDLDKADFAAVVAQYGGESTNMLTSQYQLWNLLSGGGMSSMLWTINLIICAMCFGGIMDASGMLATLAKAMLKIARNTGSLVTVTVVSCIFINIIAADQYLSIILPGRMYKEAYEDMRLAPQNLSRALEDSGTITSNLVPWNTCGATMRTFLGVQQWGAGGYAPYAFLCLFNPIISIFYGFTGISMKKLSEEEYQKVLAEREADKANAEKSLEA